MKIRLVKILITSLFTNFLYLVEEIRNMINNKEMPLFVPEIWTILINFLLRAKHESLIISKIFEDIAVCLFDRKLFENSLVCFIISILSDTKHTKPEILEKIDYLLTWFARRESIDTIHFAAIHILNVFVDKIDAINSGFIMWRCQFIRLLYSQFLHDLGAFDVETLNQMSVALNFSKKMEKCGFSSLLLEESSILEARNQVKIAEKRLSPQPINPFDNLSKSPFKIDPVIEPLPGTFNPLDLGNQESVPLSSNLETPHTVVSNYSPFDKSDLISSHIPLSPLDNSAFSPSSSEMPAENHKSPISDDDKSSISKEKSDNGGNVLGKLKSWFPVSKSGPSTQENQKQVTKAKMGKPNSFRYDEKLKKWVDDNDPSTFEQTPKLPPPPTMGVTASSNGQPIMENNSLNFRAKKGKVKYFDPLNPDGPSSTQLQPSVPNFD